jgi:hypothetical protein
MMGLPAGTIVGEAGGAPAPRSAFGSISRRHLNSWFVFRSCSRAMIDTDEPRLQRLGDAGFGPVPKFRVSW